MDTPAVSRAYLSRKLTRPLPIKDGGTLRTGLDARAYMLGLSKDRERRTQWQHAAELLLAQADVADFSKQVELALFFDAKLDVAATRISGVRPSRARCVKATIPRHERAVLTQRGGATERPRPT